MTVEYERTAAMTPSAISCRVATVSSHRRESSLSHPIRFNASKAGLHANARLSSSLRKFRALGTIRITLTFCRLIGHGQRLDAGNFNPAESTRSHALLS